MITRLVEQTLSDPKNREARIDKELWDELAEIERYHKNEVSKEYILKYWDVYTRAIS